MVLYPDKEEKFIIIYKKYILTQGQLKAFLGITGDIEYINLFEGLSPNDEEKGVSKDRQKFEIVVTEKKVVK
jgi:hypothetical protein